MLKKTNTCQNKPISLNTHIQKMNLDPRALAQQAQQQQQAKEQRKMMDEQKSMILDQIMDADAKDRLMRLKMVKPEKCALIIDSLVKSATTGQLRERVTDAALVKMLESGVDATGGSIDTRPKIKIQRRKFDSDSDDDNDDDLL